MLRGRIFGDGSCSTHIFPELRRAAAALMQRKGNGTRGWSIQCTVPPPLPQTPQAAEHVVLALVNQFAHPDDGSCLASDCLNVVSAYNGPPAAATSYKRPYAGIMRQVLGDVAWRRRTAVRKVKAHVNPAAVTEGAARDDAIDNDIVDQLAKEAVRAHPAPSPAQEAELAAGLKRARLIVRTVAKVTQAFPPMPRERMKRPPRNREGASVHMENAHRWTYSAGMWRCTACMRISLSPDVTAAMAFQKCQGPKPSLAADAIVAKGHTLACTEGQSPVLFCVRCGAFSKRRAYGLGAQCAGAPKPSGRQALARIRQGYQPWETRESGGRYRGRIGDVIAWDERQQKYVAAGPAPAEKRQRTMGNRPGAEVVICGEAPVRDDTVDAMDADDAMADRPAALDEGCAAELADDGAHAVDACMLMDARDCRRGDACEPGMAEADEGDHHSVPIGMSPEARDELAAALPENARPHRPHRNHGHHGGGLHREDEGSHRLDGRQMHQGPINVPRHRHLRRDEAHVVGGSQCLGPQRHGPVTAGGERSVGISDTGVNESLPSSSGQGNFTGVGSARSRCRGSDGGGDSRAPLRPRDARQRREGGAARADAGGGDHRRVAGPQERHGDGLHPCGMQIWQYPPSWMYLPSLGIYGGLRHGECTDANDAKRRRHGDEEPAHRREPEHAAGDAGDAPRAARGDDRGDRRPGSSSDRGTDSSAWTCTISGRGSAPGGRAELARSSRIDDDRGEDAAHGIRGQPPPPGTVACGGRERERARLEARQSHLRRSLDDHAERVAAKRARDGGQPATASAADRLAALRRRVASKCTGSTDGQRADAIFDATAQAAARAAQHALEDPPAADGVRLRQ